MRQIGVRQLKASLSETLRAVSHGEQIRVTVHGRPVADIVPAGTGRGDDRLRELAAQGRVTPAAQPRPVRAPALVEAPSASAVVLAERDDER